MASKTVSSRIRMGELQPNIGIENKNREAVLQMLGNLLADEYTLYTKTRKYHWNVTGPRFHPLHELFKAQYTQLDVIVDELAERIPQLGGKAAATMEEFNHAARISEDPGQFPDANKMISNLLADHEAIIRTLRTDSDACLEKYGDAGTNDFLIGIMEQHEKTAWMLRAHLEGRD